MLRSYLATDCVQNTLRATRVPYFIFTASVERKYMESDSVNPMRIMAYGAYSNTYIRLGSGGSKMNAFYAPWIVNVITVTHRISTDVETRCTMFNFEY